MKFKRRRRAAFDESSAASDMAFLLIIYFIVIAGFNVNKGFLMNLPAKDSTRLIQKDDLLRFEMDGDGSLLFQNEVRDIAFAKQHISSAVSGNPNIALILTIDGKAPWQRVVSFVELAEDLKIDSFSFTIKRESP
ncbi:MAG: biopolymer transporter ExbD [Treponema sp.]|jgi:biopolymer transport protein ExbD|nr:biopolymer transporter ExbD [Treponema sp.]